MDPDLGKFIVLDRKQSRNTNNFNQKEKRQVKKSYEEISLCGRCYAVLHAPGDPSEGSLGRVFAGGRHWLAVCTCVWLGVGLLHVCPGARVCSWGWNTGALWREYIDRLLINVFHRHIRMFLFTCLFSKLKSMEVSALFVPFSVKTFLLFLPITF